jgi:hypothetical protein
MGEIVYLIFLLNIIKPLVLESNAFSDVSTGDWDSSAPSIRANIFMGCLAI